MHFSITHVNQIRNLFTKMLNLGLTDKERNENSHRKLGVSIFILKKNTAFPVKSEEDLVPMVTGSPEHE